MTQLVWRADVSGRLSPATRAQLQLSRRVASDLEGATIGDIEGVITQVVNGDPGFREISREALVGVTYGPALLSPAAVHLRRACEAAIGGRLDVSPAGAAQLPLMTGSGRSATPIEPGPSNTAARIGYLLY